MGKFLESEKDNAAEFKSTSAYISDAARQDSIYKGKPRPFCLPRAHVVENLFPTAPLKKNPELNAWWEYSTTRY